MKYYRYKPDAMQYNGVGLQDRDRKIIWIHSKCDSLAATWRPVSVHGFDDNPGIEGDFPSLSDRNVIPLFSQQAWHILSPLISYCAEALPIKHPSGKPFYLINVMEIIDCLDEERSELVRNMATGRVSRVFKYCFKTDLLQNKHIFKLPRESGGELIVDDDFRKTVEANGLEGLRFEELTLVK